MIGLIVCSPHRMYIYSISSHIYLSPSLYLQEHQGTIGSTEATVMDLIANHKLLKFLIQCRETSWRERPKIPIDKYRHHDDLIASVSLQPPVSLKVPRVIVTLTSFFVDQSLILIKKNVLGLHCSSKLEEGINDNQEWFRSERNAKVILGESFLCKPRCLICKMRVSEEVISELISCDATYWTT